MTLITTQPPSQPKEWERTKHQQWCNKNGIIIYFVPVDWMSGYLEINDNGTITKGKERYLQPRKVKGKKVTWKKNEIKYWHVVPKLYTLIYNKKHNGKKEEER